MSELFKKSFNIIKDVPFITLYFVLYLIILFLIIPFVIAGRNTLIASLISVLVMLLTCAFLSGWFGMIKCATDNYKENKTPDEKIAEMGKLKDSFFCSVAGYILPVIAGFILFIILLYLLNSYLSDVLFGKIDNVIVQSAKYANDPEALKNFFVSLPDSTWNVIFKKSIFSYIITSILTLASLFWAASLYINTKHPANPLYAIVDGVATMFKTFFETFAIFIFFIVVNFFLMFLSTFFIQNVIISFLSMILRIYFAAYIVVLIFNLYEKCKKSAPENILPALNRDNGADSIGENGSVN